MGLLDRMWADPSGQAITALAGGLLGVRRGDEGRAIQNALRTYNIADEGQRRNRLTDMQMQAYQDAAEEKKRKLEQEARALAARQQFLQGLPGQLNMPMPGGPTNANAAAQGQISPQMLSQAFALGIKPEELYALAGKSKVARTVEVDGPNGEKMIQQFDEMGRPVGPPLPGYVPPQLLDLGGTAGFVKPKAGATFAKTMTPEGRDASARGWAGVGLQRDQFALEREKFLRGTPAERAAIERDRRDAEKQARRDAGVVTQADIVIDTVDEALGNINWKTTGFVGKAMSFWPESSRQDLEGAVETIRSNIGFAQLQAMRDASPTGGALGQVAVKELEFLQAAIASLNLNQSDEKIKQSLGKVKTHFENWKAAVQPQQGGGGSSWDNADPLGLRK